MYNQFKNVSGFRFQRALMNKRNSRGDFKPDILRFDDDVKDSAQRIILRNDAYFSKEQSSKNNVDGRLTQSIRYTQITRMMIEQGVLSDHTIEADIWDEDQILIIPVFSPKDYTSLITPLSTYNVDEHILNLYGYVVNSFPQDNNGSPILDSGDPMLFDRFNSALHMEYDSDSLKIIHMVVFGVLLKMSSGGEVLKCVDHSLFVRMTNGSTFYEGIPDRSCAKCSLYMLIQYFACLLISTNESVTPVQLALLYFNLRAVSATAHYSLQSINDYVMVVEVLHVFDNFSNISDLLDNLPYILFLRHQKQVLYRNDDNGDIAVTRFQFKSATRTLIGILYETMKRYFPSIKVVSVSYMKGKKSDKTSKNFGRLALQIPIAENSARRYISIIKVLPTLSYARTMLVNGMTSFKLYLASSNECAPIDHTQWVKLRTSNGGEVRRCADLLTIDLLPHTLLAWKAKQLYVWKGVANDTSEMSYIEAKISSVGKFVLTPTDHILVSGSILSHIVAKLAENGIEINTINRSETESRLRFKSVTEYNVGFKDIFAKVLGRRERCGSKGYIKRSFSDMLLNGNSGVMYGYPEYFSVDITICYFIPDTIDVINVITPTEILDISKIRASLNVSRVLPVSDD